MRELIGYLGAWSVRAGDAVAVHAHADAPDVVRVDLVSLARRGDPATFEPVAGCPVEAMSVAPQTTAIGSWAALPVTSLPPLRDGATWALLLRPTARSAGTVAAWCAPGPEGAQAHWVLRWDGHGRLALCDGRGEPLTTVPCRLGQWQVVSLAFGHDTVQLRCAAHRGRVAAGSAPDTVTVRDARAAGWRALTIWYLGAQPTSSGDVRADFTGACEAPSIHAGVLDAVQIDALYRTAGTHAAAPSLLAAWDFGRDANTDHVGAVGRHAVPGLVHQGPMRLVPGAYWQTGVLDPARDPAGFAALRLHADDVRDAGWRRTGRYHLPVTLPSGVYGLRLTSPHAALPEVLPLWVRPAIGAATAPFAYLAPTYTYLAYGNASDAMLGPAYWGGDHPYEQRRRHHPEFGPSLYSRHPDKSGVTLVSRHRPVLTVRPGVRPWGFEADRLLTEWLACHVPAADVLTDEDLDTDGLDALAPYRVLCTGNHPEYWSSRMRQALEQWVRQGGRLLYLGGNGFYWRVSSVRELPGVIECRRPEGGTRPWIAEPGEGVHQLDGEAGGLWRRLGGAPQQLVGVGFAGQGFVRSAPYRVNAAARTGWSAFALDGIADALIGTTGAFGGGAAGQEIDRADVRLGTPPDAVVLATSQGLHDAATLRTLEELLSHEPPSPDPKVRSDITLSPIDDGAVFAVGSMAFVGALDDPPIHRLLSNVVHRFLDPTPLR